MTVAVTEESLDNLRSYWIEAKYNLNWPSVFVSPGWLQTWWQVFGSGADSFLRAVWQEDKIIGIAPCLVKEKKLSFMGSPDVCDYLDFILAPGKESDFFNALLDDLKEKGINQLDLRLVREDATVLTKLAAIARERGYQILRTPEDVSLEMDLPSTWDEYLAALTTKQRHEVRRKLRRLWEADNVRHRCLEVGQEVEDYVDTFLKLFSMSQEDKANFMTPQMESFFKYLAKSMADIGLLRFGIIELDNQPVSMTMGFDYNDVHYLYNSAYDPQFNYLSVGLLCKVLCLKESIESGKKKWDFLKGAESYKYHLGGKEVPLYGCQITMK